MKKINPINQNRFFSQVAPYMFSKKVLIDEMIENAVRAKASQVNISINDLELKITNDGSVLNDFSSLFIIADSDYSEEVESSHKPAGMGMLSLISNATEVTFKSGNQCITIVSENYFSDTDYREDILSLVQTLDEPIDNHVDGFEIIATMKEELKLDYGVRNKYRFYDIDIMINGEEIETKRKIKAFFRKEVSAGVEVVIPSKTLGINFSNMTDGFVIWHGKVIESKALSPFSIIVNGQTDLVSPVLPDRQALTMDCNGLRILKRKLEVESFDDIQESLNRITGFGKIKDILNSLHKCYSLENLDTYYSVQRHNNEQMVFDASFEPTVLVDGIKKEVEDVADNEYCVSNDNIHFIQNSIGASIAPQWVKDKFEKQCVVEITTSDKAKHANTHTEHRDFMIIAESITINGKVIDSIIITNNDGNDELWFTKDYDYAGYCENQANNHSWEYQNIDEAIDELYSDFESILTAYNDNVYVDFKQVLSGAVKHAAYKNKLESTDMDKITLVKDEDGVWKVEVESDGKVCGSYACQSVA